LFVGLVGILLVGAVNRTLARTETTGTGNGHGSQALGLEESAEQSQNNAGHAWGKGTQSMEDEPQSLSEGSYQHGAGEAVGDHEFTPAGVGELSDAEKEALIFMHEEEKLARDVYQVLFERWGLPIFQNISSSEQTHMDAVKNLLDAYDVPDPVLDGLGVFANADLQALYDDLIAQGSQSLSDALRVGAAIEEIDILDLQERLAETDNADIQQVFNNLLMGSGNHLRSFTSTLLTQTGETYMPQFMGMEAYQAVIDGSTGNSGQGRGFRGGH
jgi:hypothetical protein